MNIKKNIKKDGLRNKIVVIIILLFISHFLFSSIVKSQETQPSEETQIPDDKVASGEAFEEAAKKVLEKVNIPILEKEITIPSPLRVLAAIILGIQKEDTIKVQKLVIMIAIWFVFFFTFLDIVNLSSFFSRLTNLIIVVTIMIFLGSLGAINGITTSLLGIGNWFIFKAWPTGVTVAILIILYMLFGIYYKIMEPWRLIQEERAEKRLGQRMAIALTGWKAFRDSFMELGRVFKRKKKSIFIRDTKADVVYRLRHPDFYGRT